MILILDVVGMEERCVSFCQRYCRESDDIGTGRGGAEGMPEVCHDSRMQVQLAIILSAVRKTVYWRTFTRSVNPQSGKAPNRCMCL